MPSLQVRDLPEHLYRRLQQEAVESHRSLAQETVAQLEKALGCGHSPVERRKALLGRIAESGTPYGNLPDPAELIREDRER